MFIAVRFVFIAYIKFKQNWELLCIAKHLLLPSLFMTNIFREPEELWECPLLPDAYSS